MNISYKNFFLTASILFYLFIIAGGQKIFSATQGNDAATIETLEVDSLELGDSYAVMAYIYKIIPENILIIVTFLIGTLFIYSIYRKATKKYTSSFLFILLFIPLILTVASFQKDLILVLFIVPCVFLLDSKLGEIYKVLIILLIYISYAIIFRPYYFLIVAAFISFYIFYRSNINLKIFYLGLVILSLFFIPSSIYYDLQSSRDLVNEYRVGFNQVGNRTAFLNPYEPNSLLNFIINYLYAVIRLNFGVLFNHSIKDFLFVIYPCIYFYFCLKVGFNSKKYSYESVLAVFLILSHAMVYFLFEPDTGSYARHLSSTLPYLAFIIINSFEKISSK